MKKLILMTILGSSLLLAACQQNSENQNGDTAQTTNTTTTTTTATITSETSSKATDQNGIAVPKAELYDETITKFQSAHTEAIITSFKWEAQGPNGQVEIEGKDSSQEYQMIFDASGKLLGDTSEVNDDKNWQEDEVQTDAVISLSDAIEKAHADTEGSVTSAELEKDDGVTKWEVKLLHTNQEIELTLDAQGGKILNKDVDD